MQSERERTIEPGPPEPLLAVRIAEARYPNGARPVLRDLNLDVLPGEILGLAGQSGSGKSTLAMAVLGLLGRDVVRGTIRLHGSDLNAMNSRELRRIRGREAALVFQGANALNPRLRIETQLREAWEAHAETPWRVQRQSALPELLAGVGLPAEEAFLRRYPDQISIGQAQRVLLAMALLHKPPLLIADEPTSALDLITQADVLALLREWNRRLGMAILFISHDLAAMAEICHRVAILHEGSIVECGPTAGVLRHPSHPYTQRLVAALPRLSIG